MNLPFNMKDAEIITRAAGLTRQSRGLKNWMHMGRVGGPRLRPMASGKTETYFGQDFDAMGGKDGEGWRARAAGSGELPQ